MIKPCADKHLDQGRRDIWERDFEQEQRKALHARRCRFALFASQFLAHRVAREQNKYDDGGARLEQDLVIKRGATKNATKWDCKDTQRVKEWLAHNDRPHGSLIGSIIV